MCNNWRPKDWKVQYVFKFINTSLVIVPGGPLTVEEVSYVLAGVVSGGGKVCGKPRVPSIYTRVARYADWLKVGKLSFARLTSNLSDGDTTEMNAVVDLGWNHEL